MFAIKHAYQTTFGRSMEADVKDDLSMKTERLFGMVMAANRADESTPINLQELDHDCSELHRATEGKVGTDQITVCNILASRSDGQLRAIAQHYQQKYHIALVDVVKKEFSSHMEDALLLMLNRALDRAMTDAVQLEETMKGFGTRDSLLVNRVVRVHWDKGHLDQVRKAYMHRYKRDLIARVKGETKGDFEKLLVACLEG
jgi:annexin A7/11